MRLSPTLPGFAHKASPRQNVQFSGSTDAVPVGMGPVTDDDVRALKAKFKSILLGREPVDFSEAGRSEFKLGTMGIGTIAAAIGPDWRGSALVVESKTESGRDKIIEKILSLPGGKRESGQRLQRIPYPGGSDPIVSLPFNGKQLPIVVSFDDREAEAYAQ